jgi:SAM-dependent methyltransferase
VNPRPTQVLLNTFYDSESYVCHNPEAGSTKTGRFLLESVARYGPYQDNQFLDFGCGGGFLLRAAMEDKWDAIGYDVGRRALDSCNSQGLTVTDNLAEIAPAGFDVVFLNHVFEHIAQPQGVLSLCHRLLSKSGKLFVVVPNLAGLRARLSFAFLSRHFNVDERHRAFPIHLFYFTPRTLVKTLESNGFRVAAVETFGLGMDEFVNHPEGGADGAMTPARAKTATAKKSSGFRQIVKGTLFSAALGENLLAVASPI